MPDSSKPIIEVRGVNKSFDVSGQQIVALKDASLTIHKGEFITLIGASGCGKSTLLRIIAGFEKPTAGEALMWGLPIDGPAPLRGMVFQDYALFPWLTVRDNISFGPISQRWPKAKIRETADRFIEMVGLQRFADAYPHQLSGGMRQRVTIALATLLKPRIIIGDEPTTALDVVVQRGVVQLLRDVQRNLQNTIILVTHDMGVHANVADRIGIMYAGKIVEEAPTEKIFGEPAHPYTQYLINSLPKFGDKTTRESVPGSPPSLANLPSGCPFHPRCPFVKEICKTQMPGFTQLDKNHRVACWLVGEGDNGTTA